MIHHAPSVVLMAGAIPLVWSVVAYGLHRAAAGAPVSGGMRRELFVLAVMTAPVAFGAAALVAPPLAPAAALTVFDLPNLSGGHAVGATPPRVGGAATRGGAVDLYSLAALALIAVYLIGLAVAAARLLRARSRLRRVAAESRQAPSLGARARITDEPAPPFASACGAVVIPRRLVDALPPDQVALVVRHEHAHLRRGDTHAFQVLAWIDAAFWFNPVIRQQTNRCRLAAELACDAAVVGAAPHRRAVYARAIVSAIKQVTADTPRWAPTIIPPTGETRMRLIEIMAPAPARRRLPARTAATAAALLAAPVMLIQLGWAHAPAQAQTAAQTAGAFAFSTLPLQGRISSTFGPRSDPFTGEEANHSGIDIVAEEGAPILAPANGVVTFAGERGGYGQVIELDHIGEVRTRFGQLSAYAVTDGDQVAAGQVIGYVGATGRATGPHLHMEYWRREPGEEWATYDPLPLLAAIGLEQ